MQGFTEEKDTDSWVNLATERLNVQAFFPETNAGAHAGKLYVQYGFLITKEQVSMQ